MTEYPTRHGRIYLSADHGTAYVADGDPPPDWATAAPDLEADELELELEVDDIDDVERPLVNDPKAAWVAYATRVGIAAGATMTKAEIIDATARIH